MDQNLKTDAETLTKTLCGYLAAAEFGDPEKVKYVPLTSQNRFTALQSAEIDVLIRETTWTLGREASLGAEFAGINFYDGTAVAANFLTMASRSLRSLSFRLDE